MQSFKNQNTWLSHFTLFVSVSPHLHLVTLITESASICPVCKDLISDKMSAQGLCGIWYEQWHRSSNASERFFDNPSHDKLYRSCLPIICSVRCLLVKTQSVVCLLSLISALSLLLFVSLSFVLHSNSWVLLTSLKASLESPDSTRKKGNNICLSAYFYVQTTRGKNTELDRGHETSQSMRN